MKARSVRGLLLEFEARADGGAGVDDQTYAQRLIGPLGKAVDLRRCALIVEKREILLLQVIDEAPVTIGDREREVDFVHVGLQRVGAFFIAWCGLLWFLIGGRGLRRRIGRLRSRGRRRLWRVCRRWRRRLGRDGNRLSGCVGKGTGRGLGLGPRGRDLGCWSRGRCRFRRCGLRGERERSGEHACQHNAGEAVAEGEPAQAWTAQGRRKAKTHWGCFHCMRFRPAPVAGGGEAGWVINSVVNCLRNSSSSPGSGA
jgi:hypothetical protein